MNDTVRPIPGQLNEGTAWRHPLESWYGRARRRLVANPMLGLSAFNEVFEHRHDLAGIDTLDPYLGGLAGVRQCAECAQRLFHPAVYNVRSLLKCPVHAGALTTVCPDCHQPWERALSERTSVSSTCARRPWPALGRVYLKAKVYRELRWLNNWLTRCQRRRHNEHHPTLYDIRKLIARVGDIENPRFTTPTPRHAFYVAFEAQKEQGRSNDRLERLQVRTHEKPLREREASLRPWLAQVDLPRPLVTWSGQQGNEPAPSAQQIRNVALAIRRLMRWQRGLTGHPHALNWWDLRSLRPEDVREQAVPCVLCMAFSYWCHALTWKYIQPSGAGTPGEHELCRLTGYTQFPNTPEQVYLETPNGSLLRPSPDFERWLYLRSTDYLFMECIQFVLWVQQRTADTTVCFQKTSYSPSHRFKYPPMASQLLDVEQYDGKLKATYWYRSPLEELTLPNPALRPIHRCAAFLTQPCDRIWSIPSDPREVRCEQVRELFNEVLPQLKWSERQYAHYPHFFLPPPTSTTYCHDMRSVIGGDKSEPIR